LLSGDHNHSKERNLVEEREIIFHAMDLDPLIPNEHLSPLDPSFEEWLETLVPKALNVANKNGLFHQLPQQYEEDEIDPYERAEPTEDVPNIGTLTLDSAAVSPCQSVSDLSENNVGSHKQKLLWGKNGLLGLKEDVPSDGARRKSGLIRTMTKKLKHQLNDMVSSSLYLHINFGLIIDIFL
jgi:hypothetical protein